MIQNITFIRYKINVIKNFYKPDANLGKNLDIEINKNFINTNSNNPHKNWNIKIKLIQV